MTPDIPEGSIKKQTQTDDQLSSFPSAIMDDTVYLMDDPAANMGGTIVISTNITGTVVRDKPEGK